MFNDRIPAHPRPIDGGSGLICKGRCRLLYSFGIANESDGAWQWSEMTNGDEGTTE